MSRRYCFTWNNYTNDDEATLEEFAEDHCNYLVYGKEVAPTTLTPHLQGFFTLKKVKRIPALKKLLGDAPHFTVAKAKSERAANYCKKGMQSHEEWEEHQEKGENFGLNADVTEFGTLPSQGKRTDLEMACDAIKSGSSLRDIAEEHPSTFVKYARGLRDLKLTLGNEYNHDDVRGTWYYGPPGTGKSRRAREENPGAYLKNQNKWWDGYNGEHAVILDDFDKGGSGLGHHLKIWADRYACTGETKGGTINLQHRKFVVTSNYHPADIWTDDEPMLEAIERRFRVEKIGERVLDLFYDPNPMS